MGTETSFESAVQHHDQCLAKLGLAIWVGSEPTFTDREAQTPPWLNTALGGDKEGSPSVAQGPGIATPAGARVGAGRAGVFAGMGQEAPGSWHLGIW